MHICKNEIIDRELFQDQMIMIRIYHIIQVLFKSIMGYDLGMSL